MITVKPDFGITFAPETETENKKTLRYETFQ